MPSMSGVSKMTKRLSAAIPFASSMALKCSLSSVR